jgi:hypothetical protein
VRKRSSRLNGSLSARLADRVTTLGVGAWADSPPRYVAPSSIVNPTYAGTRLPSKGQLQPPLVRRSIGTATSDRAASIGHPWSGCRGRPRCHRPDGDRGIAVRRVVCGPTSMSCALRDDPIEPIAPALPSFARGARLGDPEREAVLRRRRGERIPWRRGPTARPAARRCSEARRGPR